MKSPPFADPAVKAVFDAYAPPLRTALLDLRKLIYSTAARTEGVGDLSECLKWQQPAYLTNKSRSGSTIRIDAVRAQENSYAAYFHCQTDLVSRFRELYPRTFNFEGNRALHFKLGRPIPEPELRHCIALALTYHLAK
ncbi:MAG: DUF1801 domain-containing protein [Hyphomicrobiales bacterium]